MCGRYASSRPTDYLVAHFGVQEPPEQVLPPSWNVAPTDPVHVVAVRHGRRRLVVAHWGLVPSWAKDGRGAARLINARSETVQTTPAFRSAFARRRCLVPADGYYEWQPAGGRKQPWYLSSRDGTVLAMAGLYEVRQGGGGSPRWTCSVITTRAPDGLGRIHDRTPLIVPRAHWERWLDPAVPDPGRDLLVPGAPGVLHAWPVDVAVGNVRHNRPDLVRPVQHPAYAAGV